MTITQDMLYRQSICKYAIKNGVTKAARQYRTTRQYIYYWARRYNGTVYSLAEKSRKPQSHPNQHTEEELKLIVNLRRRNPKEGLFDFYVRLYRKGYKRTMPGLYKVMRRLELFSKNRQKKPKYVPKHYQEMKTLGERIQIDVKFVPKECYSGEGKLYQYTAIDEKSRQRFLYGYNEHSSYTAADFANRAVAFFNKQGYDVKCIQTDNGCEFTTRFLNKNGSKTMFQVQLDALGIRHKLIKPYTPRHNGKVERSHRKDSNRFYSKHTFYSVDDFNKQLKKYNKEYNDYPTLTFKMLSPNQFAKNFMAKCNTCLTT